MLFPSQKTSFSYSLFKSLRHQSVSGAPPVKKNPGSAPGPRFGGGAGKAREKHPGDEVDRIVNYNIRILKLE